MPDLLTRVMAGALIAIVVAAPACSHPDDTPPPRKPLSPGEIALRTALGVPLDAEKVLVFGQNAHLDLDWQKTFDGYYTAFVSDIFLEARAILGKQARAHYAIAEMAFLEHHLTTHPEEVDALRAAVARGALHVVGGGMSSPDTLLPESELLARDYLYGLRFAEDRLGAHPTAAWLPDSFGHSAATPDVLAAAGFESVAFSRIDGAPTYFDQLFHKDVGQRPGSTAEALQKLGSADFVWRGVSGATVIAHFMPAFGLYCQGDNIDYAEGIQVPGGHTGNFHGDEPDFTDGQIDEYAQQLEPWRKTPYMFVPVGCDFQHPKERLIEYLDGYDKRRYPTTHVWAVAAPFDQYVKLITPYQAALPTISGELSPYFMGFYGSRADLKRGVRDAARPFFVAEAFAVVLGDEGKSMVAGAAPDLSKLTRADHHDFVTGTSADPVVADEQLPLLRDAEKAGRAELSRVATAIARRVPMTTGATARLLVLNPSDLARSAVTEVDLPITAGAPVELHAVSGTTTIPIELASMVGPADTTARVRLSTSDLAPLSYRAVDILPGAGAEPTSSVKLSLLDASGAPATGGAITDVRLENARVRARLLRSGPSFALTSLTIDGVEGIARPSLRLVDYKDDGGLWRLGNEMGERCALSPLPAVDEVETVSTIAKGALRVSVAFQSGTARREVWLDEGAEGLSIALETAAKEGTTRTLAVSFLAPADARLRTSTPFGWIDRPREYLYAPTFWPAVDFVEVAGWTVLLRQSTGVRMSSAGEVELMAARDARAEKCDAEGGSGSDTGKHRIEWRIERAPSPLLAARAARAFDRGVATVPVGTDQAVSLDLPLTLSLGSIEGEGMVSALKPAERGPGVVLRLHLTGAATVRLGKTLSGLQTTLVDLAERDLRPLGAVGDTLTLDAKTHGGIASVRLR